MTKTGTLALGYGLRRTDPRTTLEDDVALAGIRQGMRIEGRKWKKQRTMNALRSIFCRFPHIDQDDRVIFQSPRHILGGEIANSQCYTYTEEFFSFN